MNLIISKVESCDSPAKAPPVPKATAADVAELRSAGNRVRKCPCNLGKATAAKAEDFDRQLTPAEVGACTSS